MRVDLDSARQMGYSIALLGVGLALVTAFVPQPTGAHKLAWGQFMWSMVPYLVYSGFTILSNASMFLTAGVLILILDAYAHLHNALFPEAPLPPELLRFLPLWLTIIAIPAGLGLGRILSGLVKTARPGGESDEAPDASSA